MPPSTGDKDVLLAAVAQDGRALRYGTPALRGDRDVVLVAVARHAEALQHAAPTLQDDTGQCAAQLCHYVR